MALWIVALRFQDALRAPSTVQPATRMFAPLVFSALFATSFWQWNDPWPILYPQGPWALGRIAQVSWLCLVLTYLPFVVARIREHTWLRHGRFVLFGAALLLGGYDTIRTSPRPGIDVWTVQQEGAAHFLAGRNPYREVAVRDTGPRTAADVPYVYPPTQLYLTAPAWKLGDDVRWTMLLAVLVTGFALRQITRRAPLSLPAILEDAPALFVWLSPKLFFILEQAWVDPVQLMLVSLTTWAHVARRPVLTAVALGVVVSAKQTMFWMIPLAGFLLWFTPRQWLIAAAVALASVLPFVVWDFPALRHANLGFLSSLPPRADGLTLVNWASRKFQVVLPGTGLAFLLALLVVGLSIWRRRESTTARFAVAALATYCAFFAFNKWAFANYYFLLMGLAALAAACSGHFASRLQPQPAVSYASAPQPSAPRRD
jgi:hypothetical protein